MPLELTKLKRQIEILGLALGDNRNLTVGELADRFGCDEVTIKRDLQALRSHGIDIHSQKKKGVRLLRSLEPSKLQELIVQYIGLSNAQRSLDKATTILVQKHKERAFTHIVILQRCIDCNLKASIDYFVRASTVERNVAVCPRLIFQSENNWRLLATHGGVTKQYLLTKLINVQATNQTFKKIPVEEIENLFRFSWRSWIGPERFKVKLKLSRAWANRLKPHQLMESQVLMENPDGSVIFETTVNSLAEIASWIVSRGKGVVVIEPKELKKEVIALAKGALRNYRLHTF